MLTPGGSIKACYNILWQNLVRRNSELETLTRKFNFGLSTHCCKLESLNLV